MKTYLIFFAAFFILTDHSQGQFQLKYEGGWSELIKDIDFFKNGTVMTGQSIKSPMSAIALRVRDDQQLLWTNKYFIQSKGTNSIAYFNDVRSFSIGPGKHLAITGGSSWISATNGKSDMLFSILNENGTPWKSSLIGTAEYDAGLVVKRIRHPQYGPAFIVVGETHPAPNPNYYWNITVSILDINGILKQSAVYDAPGRQKIYDVAQAGRNYILVGETSITHNCDRDSIAALVMSVNNQLTPVWNKVIDIKPEGHFSKDAAMGVSVFQNNIWVAGRRNNSSGFGPASLLMKMDLSGTISWLKEYDVTLAEAFGQKVMPNGTLQNLILTLYGLMAADAMGNPLWYKEYPGGLPFLRDLAVSQAYKGYGICGRDVDPSTLLEDVYLLRTDDKGATNTVCEYDIVPQQRIPEYCELEIPVDVVGRLAQKKTRLVYRKFPLKAFDCQYNALKSYGHSSGSIYPSPARDYLFVKGGQVEKATLYSLSGWKINSILVKNNQIDVSDLLPGMYIVHLFMADGIEVKYHFRKE